ncbi:hypothetical protein [Methanobrevibacter sp.]|uniref:hypothetical protein n=1 Tax=Methanobrevibacter sp. TaxID=66852 RepID=UPI00388DBF92
MGLVYDVFDKYSILDIIIGFALGYYLAVYHDDPNLWIIATIVIVGIGAIISIMPIIASLRVKIRGEGEISVPELLEAFLLNVAMLAVSTSLGFVIGSIAIGNFIVDSLLIFF